uniref:Frizzled/Smoothened 7TM domain-containing protein n=1 Tax=Tetraodon nigroviridis TaxID=99883 RepID=H3CWG9_TETNG
QAEQSSRPALGLFLLKYVMTLVVGIPSVFWVGSRKTCFEWAGFFHGRRWRRSAMVKESRQVLQEPDFARLLLRDPNTPVVRKSRGTSTQGTSTRASSTHLAMLDEPASGSTSRAGSLRSSRSKASSYHGSLHRSRDGRWGSALRVFKISRHAGSGFRVAERLPYGSLPRLDGLSHHGSTQRLESPSRPGSIRDLSSTTQTVLCVPGNGIRRVLEEGGGRA